MKERFDIKENISKVKYQVCYTGIKEIVNEREDIKGYQKIKMSYDCIIKIN